MSLSDAAYCQAVVRSHARTFHRASGALPAEKRRAAFAVYAFCRMADDLADAPSTHADAAAEELARHERGLHAMVAGSPTGPIFRELAGAVERHAIPHAPLRHLITAVRSDLAMRPYEDWPALRTYCEGVASTVGEVCAHVFGLPDDPGSRALALRHARILGVALQLTNILRDVGEDAAIGRCYLPLEDLRRFGLSEHDVLARRLAPSDERWRGLMAFEIARARALYQEALPGITLLSPDAQRCALMCARGYSRILDAIEEIDYDSLGRRARVGIAARAALLCEVWRDTPPVRRWARA
ncbi:MAG TPA: phytoene/squalene synthase family protein [Gemmatimonadaceae bacterium]|nr:phytoene/squalene synthase family protein [Gemmatimonadaceae bacterium]